MSNGFGSLKILEKDSEDRDQTARMRRMVWAFSVHIAPKTPVHKYTSTFSETARVSSSATK